MDTKQQGILIVDDNPENLRVLSTLLEKEGYAVRVAMNGAAALETIGAQTPDLILLDVHLPEMNGFDVCRRVLEQPAYADIPVLFLSGLGDSFNKLKGFQAGGRDYMTKPFDADEVCVRVKTHLELRARLLEVTELQQQLAERDEEIARLKAELGRGS